RRERRRPGRTGRRHPVHDPRRRLRGPLGHVHGVPAHGRRVRARRRALSACDSIPALAGLIHGARRLNAYQAILLPDSLPPAPVADLAVESGGSTALGLTWTASGDDDTSGTAASYDRR